MSKRRLFAALAAAALALTSLAGCSGGASTATTAAPAATQAAPAETTAAPAAAAPAETTAAPAPAPSGKVVKLGFLGPITGGDAAEGAAARNAFMLAIKQANASGEYPYTIEVIEIDDQAKPEVGAAGAQKIVADPAVVAASGHWNSGVAEATIPVFKENEIPLLIWGAIRESLTSPENYPWITRSAPTDVQENVPLAKAVLDDMKYDKIFIISDLTTYGEGNTTAFTKEMEARGLTPLGVEKVQTGTVDFRPILQKVKDSGANCVYWGGVVTEGSMLKQQMYEEQLDALFCGISGNYSQDFLKIGAEAAEGALIVKPGIELDSTPEGQKFVADYEAEKFSEPIGAYTPYAYEAALILLNALKACGADPTPEAMRDAIKDGSTTGIMGTTTFNEIGQTTNVAAYLNVVQDGEWVVYDKSEYKTGARQFPGK
ncbi:MAG: branched-chain amino acid ABC transporter substrate-binding protein [Lachnospiraceae bacterium]|jgi:branched-chain amino acid transport system substrate-binding protein|nr:branched-chain amino acid ABC transporter substrate-binding protein [Lachnospiraceae bacterium]